MTTLTILIALNALAFWQKHVFIYCLMVPLNMVYGLNLAADATQGEARWVEGIIIALLGTLCLFKVAVLGWQEAKKRRG